jgi:hypothetical protein
LIQADSIAVLQRADDSMFENDDEEKGVDSHVRKSSRDDHAKREGAPGLVPPKSPNRLRPSQENPRTEAQSHIGHVEHTQMTYL